MPDERNVLQYETSIPTNEFGQPVFRAAIPAKLELRIRQSPNEPNEVDIVGPEKALLALAEILIGVAKTPGFHIHLGEEHSGDTVAFRGGEVRVTIYNADQPARKSLTSEQPNDWARG
jgi:hypothetical protein